MGACVKCFWDIIRTRICDFTRRVNLKSATETLHMLQQACDEGMKWSYEWHIVRKNVCNTGPDVENATSCGILAHGSYCSLLLHAQGHAVLRSISELFDRTWYGSCCERRTAVKC